MTLRERVARLESVLEKVLKILPSGIIQDNSYAVPQSSSDTEDITTNGHDLDNRAPFVSILDDAEVGDGTPLGGLEVRG
jgi:hypothetical protein